MRTGIAHTQNRPPCRAAGRTLSATESRSLLARLQAAHRSCRLASCGGAESHRDDMVVLQVEGAATVDAASTIALVDNTAQFAARALTTEGAFTIAVNQGMRPS